MIPQVFGRHTGGKRTYNSSSEDGSVALIGEESAACLQEHVTSKAPGTVARVSRTLIRRQEMPGSISISKSNVAVEYQKKKLRDVRFSALEDVLLSHHFT